MIAPKRAALAALFSMALSSPVLARPSLWQRVKSPEARREASLLVSLERAMDEARELGYSRGARGLVAMAELEGVTEPKDPYLACVIGRALAHADIGREADARRLLEGALEHFPEGSRAAAAWRTLASVYGRLDDPKAEHHAHTRVIELTWDPDVRADAFYSRAEVSMLLRHPEEARDDYRAAVRGAHEPSTFALASYGLAVAEERLGDLLAAYATFDKAATISMPVPPFESEDPLDLPGVFFEPPYEENYLRALRAMAAARRSSDPRERLDAYETALVEWDTYLARSPDDEPYRENARSHRARAERELEKPPPSRPQPTK